MFTGIVEELGEITAVETLYVACRFRLRGPVVTEGAQHGDSIAVNGCCLTVTELDGDAFTADVMKESLARTSLGDLVVGSPVNLERAVAAGARLGGHIVQGHVDGVGSLLVAEGGAPLKGTKRGVVGSRRPFVGIGTKDGRSLAIVPMVDARLRCTALALLHLKFRDAMPVEEKVRVLGPRRLEEIVNGVVEADIPWKDALLDAISPKDLVARSPQQTVDAIVARARG